jgi:hypothetical protein
MIFIFRILQLDLPFYATIALLLLMHYYRKQSITDGVSGKFFLTILYTLLLSNLLSITSILINGQDYRLAYQLNTLLIYIRHLISILPLYGSCIHFILHIVHNLENIQDNTLKNILYYFITYYILINPLPLS